MDYIREYYKDLIEKFEGKQIIKEQPKYVKDIKEGKLQRELNEILKKKYDGKEKWKQIKEILGRYKLTYTKGGEDWIIKRVLIIDLENE